MRQAELLREPMRCFVAASELTDLVKASVMSSACYPLHADVLSIANKTTLVASPHLHGWVVLPTVCCVVESL